MKKLLILAYDFPPYVSVGGLRPYNWYKYLSQFDVYPVVVTRQWGNHYKNHLDYIAPSDARETVIEESESGTIIRAPYFPNMANRWMIKYGDSKFRIVRKMVSAFYEFAQFLYPIGTKIELYRAAKKYLAHNQVDAIIATGDPFILFKYAAQLGQSHAIPWIADYRDAWVQDPRIKSLTYKIWCAFFERKFLRSASKVTTVTRLFQKQIESNLRGKSFEILYNGYDPEVVRVIQTLKPQRGCLSIAFAGTIYDWHPSESFLRVCQSLLQENPDFSVEIHFYGLNKETELKECLANAGASLRDHVYFHERTDNLKVVQLLAQHHVFLLFNDYSYPGTKIYDYLAIRRKILLCYENDEEARKLKKQHYPVEENDATGKNLQADILRATDAGVVVRDAAHLRQILLEMNNEMRVHGFIACHSHGIEEYSRVRQVEKLAAIVHELPELRAKRN